MKNFMAKLGRLLDRWADIETQFITLFTIVMGAIIMVDVVFRNLGMQGISWVEEFGRFMLVATTLLGCSIAVRSNGHMLNGCTLYCPPCESIVCTEVHCLCRVLCYVSLHWLLQLWVDDEAAPHWKDYAKLSVSSLDYVDFCSLWFCHHGSSLWSAGYQVYLGSYSPQGHFHRPEHQGNVRRERNAY